MTDRGALLRLPRAAMFAAVCVALAAAGHGWMASRPAPLWSLAVGAVVVLALAAAAAGAERSLGAIVAGLLPVQLGLHLLFTLASGPTMATGSAAHAGHATDAGSTGSTGPPLPADLSRLLECAAGDGQAGAGMPTARLLAPLGMSASAARAALGRDLAAHTEPAAGGHLLGGSALAGHSGLGMFLAHLAAALIAACWLWRGEAATHALARWAGARALGALRRLVSLVAGARPARDPLAGLTRRLGQADDRPAPATSTLRHLVTRRGPPPLLQHG